MERVLQLLNQLKNLGLIGDFAIGGGVATILHSVAYTTKDLDIFTTLPKRSGLVDLGPIWEYLQKNGGVPQGQFIVVDEVYIDFIDPRPNSIEDEALQNAQVKTIYNIAVNVFRPEYMIAIYLQLGRPEDSGKLYSLWSHAQLDANLLDSIIEKHGLQKKWQEFRTKNT